MDDSLHDPANFLIAYPCFILMGKGDSTYACHLLDDGGHAVAVLTDEDSLDCYRRDLDLPDRGAERFDNAEQLLAALRGLPPQVAYISYDMRRRHEVREGQAVRVWEIEYVLGQLAAQVPAASGAARARPKAARIPRVITFTACREIRPIPQTSPPEHVLVAPAINWWSASYPARVRMGLYVEYTGAEGAYETRVDVYDGDGDLLGPLVVGAPPVSKDPVAVHSITQERVSFDVPRPGLYDLVLFFNGEEAARR